MFVSFQDQLLSMSATIPRWSVDVFNLDAASISQTDPGLQQRYIHITSDHSVAVYLSAYTGSVGSTFLVYPVSSLSTRYMVAPYLPDSGYVLWTKIMCIMTQGPLFHMLTMKTHNAHNISTNKESSDQPVQVHMCRLISYFSVRRYIKMYPRTLL